MELMLAAYADGMAVPEDRRHIEGHIKTCQACRQDLDAQMAMRQALTAHRRSMVPQAPPGLATRISALLAAEQRPVAEGWWGFRLSAFAAAALVVLAVSAVALPVITGRSTVVLAAQLALDHLKCFAIEPHDHGESVTVAEAEAELKRDYGWDVTVPPTAGAPDGRLVAVRRCLYGDGRAAHLLYTVGGAPVSLFIMPGVERPAADLAVFGQSEVVWSKGGRTYMLVADASQHTTLQSMASNLQNGAE
jgi:anti-sigma factor RsiW